MTYVSLYKSKYDGVATPQPYLAFLLNVPVFVKKKVEKKKKVIHEKSFIYICKIEQYIIK